MDGDNNEQNLQADKSVLLSNPLPVAPRWYSVVSVLIKLVTVFGWLGISFILFAIFALGSWPGDTLKEQHQKQLDAGNVLAILVLVELCIIITSWVVAKTLKSFSRYTLSIAVLCIPFVYIPMLLIFLWIIA